jgi:hypothetical protein
MNEEILDGRESVPIDLPKEELFQLMLRAHEKDVTLNQLVESILRELIEREENESRAGQIQSQ